MDTDEDEEKAINGMLERMRSRRHFSDPEKELERVERQLAIANRYERGLEDDLEIIKGELFKLQSKYDSLKFLCFWSAVIIGYQLLRWLNS